MANAKAKVADPELKYIPLVDIIADPNQPRRYFDEHQMKELFESVKELGVKQPILVRPHGEHYMIVAGERRWRAAKGVMVHFPYRDSIPAMVEILTNQEALEIQITENLQRAEVKPMEEAVVFKSLIDHHNMTIEELALRVGKSQKFVAQRLNLNNLIPDFQEMLDRGICGIGEAYEIARVSKELQEALLHDRTTDYHGDNKFDWRDKNNFELGNLYFIQNKQNSLSPAPFNVTDETLNPSMGTCITCPSNSANNSLLFEGETAKCTNPVCFNIKKNKSLIDGIQSAIECGKVLVVRNYGYNINETLQEYAKSEGSNILTYDHYSTASKVDNPGTWEQYRQEEKWWDDEDMEDDDFVLGDELSKLRESYQEAIKEYDDEQEQIKKNGPVGILAYDVDSGNDLYIQLKKGKGFSITGAEPLNEEHDEINRIQVREIRAQQLDGEKIWTKVRELLPNNLHLLVSERDLTTWMIPIAIRAIHEKLSWHNRKWIDDLIQIDNPGLDDLNKGLAALMVDALVGNYGSHLTKGSGNEMMFKYIKFFLKDEVTSIELEQQEIAIKRQERVNKKILGIDPNYRLKPTSVFGGSVFTSKEEEE